MSQLFTFPWPDGPGPGLPPADPDRSATQCRPQAFEVAF